MTGSEAEGLRWAVAGDGASFQAFFETHKSAVYSTCLRLSGRREEAEDLTQEVFFKAWLSAGAFRFEAKPSTWLYRIAVNLFLDRSRREKIKRILSLDALIGTDEGGPADDPTGSPEDDPGRSFEREEAARSFRRALAALPGRQRAAVVLHHDEGLSCAETADIMGLSVSSVESLLVRARMNLALRMEERPASARRK